MKVRLYLDTSILGLAFALTDEYGKILYEDYTCSKGGASLSLSLRLRSALEKLSLNESHVTVIVVSKGPGTFTGIRIGLAWAMGFCTKASGRQLLGVSSLSCLASAFRQGSSSKKTSILLANTKNTGFLASSEENKSHLSFVEECFPEVEKGETLFVDSFYERIERLGVKEISKEDLARQALHAMISQVDIHDQSLVAKNSFIEPFYLRKSSVEEKK